MRERVNVKWWAGYSEIEWCHTLREYYYLDFIKYKFGLENRESRIRGQGKYKSKPQ